ncbi:MAG TPA: hypothetical protein VFA43_05890, partial [Gemmatimonadaceae bacterium]|nr:hypothetical protein [Gemmatimonadaceae bacterium]
RARDLLSVDVAVQTSDDGIMLRLPALAAAPPIRSLLAQAPAEVERAVLDEVGNTPLFGARFRMNAARALLLPRGRPNRRMPLWLQRLKATDLLQAVRQYPEFPILVETYREVLRDAFDMDALTDILRQVESGKLPIRIVETERPSPFAAGLQLGFVMEWLYADDTPRAERAATLLSVDRGLLDDVLGVDDALDEATTQAIEEILAIRRGTAPGRQAGNADELSQRLERAGELTLEELAAREAPESGALQALLDSGRVIKRDNGRYILREYNQAPRREMLARYLSLAGLVSAEDVAARYPNSKLRLIEWEKAGTLVRVGDRWISRSVLERARRRALAKLRAQIEATDLPTFAAFLQRWQHVDPRDRLDEEAGLALIMEQLDGLARPADSWERDYLPARMTRYDPTWLTRAAGAGTRVWAGVPPTRVRFFERGEGALWQQDLEATLSDTAQSVRDALVNNGASFLTDITVATGLGPIATQDALRELAQAGIVTNDSIDAMREVMHQRPLPSRRSEPDPTRWLPDTFVTSRRPNPRRLPRWQRPDRPRAQRASNGRWSLLDRPGTRGPALDEDARAAAIAQKWLVRYGVVTRDWWRRERPPVSWRAIYRELKRLELRGEVRRGYFVEGLAGAQFALPEAVERLRAAREDPDAPLIAIASTDPSYPDLLPRPRGASALIITRRGKPVMTVEANGRRVTILGELSDAEMSVAVALITKRRGGRRHTLETIDGRPAATSPHAEAFQRAGFRMAGLALDYP